MIPESSNHLGLLIVTFSFGVIFLMLKIFQIEDYNWLYAIPIALLFLHNLIDSNKNKIS